MFFKNNKTDRAELFCIQLPSDSVLEVEGPLIINMFMIKMDYDTNELICSNTYFRVLNMGEIRNTSYKLCSNTLPSVIGLACTSYYEFNKRLYDQSS
jgi:hypothetical protein